LSERSRFMHSKSAPGSPDRAGRRDMPWEDDELS
jgi:hypothetical protein